MIEDLIGKYGWMRHEHPYVRSVLYRHRRSVVLAAVGIVASVITVMAALPASGVGDNNRFGLFVVSGFSLLLVCWAEWRAGRPRTVDPELVNRCRHLRHRSRSMLRLSAVFWLTAVIGTFILPALCRFWVG